MTVQRDLLPFVLGSQQLSLSKLYSSLLSYLPFFPFLPSSPQQRVENTILENTENPPACAWGTSASSGFGGSPPGTGYQAPICSPHESPWTRLPSLPSPHLLLCLSLPKSEEARLPFLVWVSLDVTVRLGFTCHKHGKQGRWVLRWVLSFRKALPGAGGGCGRGLKDRCWVAVGLTQPWQILGIEPVSCRRVLGCNSVPPPLNTPARIWCSSGL